MPHYRQVGSIPRKRHTLLRVGEGETAPIAVEELMGLEGFSESSSLLYHRTSPSALSAIEAVDREGVPLHPNLPVTPRHLRPRQLDSSTDLVTGRHVLLGNDTVKFSWVHANGTSPLYRNAVGDELIYVQSGTAIVESVFGSMEVSAGDYVVVPTSTTHRWVHETAVEALVIEARGHVRIPARYLTSAGQLVEGAPFSERDVRGPSGELLEGSGRDVPVLVRTRAGWSRHVYRDHPFDVVGWDGCLYPWAVSIHDFEPLVGRIHQPPPVHQTFAGPGFVICSFVPRLFDFDPNAVKVPYFHSNVDSDEVLFYSQGNFMSRAGSGIEQGSISLHPAGHIHGPQPGSYEASIDKLSTSEVAVMMDTFAPLGLSTAAEQVNDPSYLSSWNR
jgi:homogentisate 1,2-dioxygenase